MTDRDYRFGFSGTDLISPLQFYFRSDLNYPLPMALFNSVYRLDVVQGEINDPELSVETRQKARKNRHVLNGWITYYKEQLGK